MAAIRFAHAQVVDLRQELKSNLGRVLWGDINRTWWSIMNHMDVDDISKINSVIDETFETAIVRWRNVESVRSLLERACEILKEAAWVSLNVSWYGQEGADAHIHAVFENLMDVFDGKYFCKIRKAMLDISPNVLKIQRAWRRVSTDPAHLACRRRLLREFDAFAMDLENMKV